MAKPKNKNLENAIIDMQTGQYSLCQIAKKWKIDKATLSREFSKNKTTINQHAKNAIEHTSKGIAELGELLNEPEIKQQLINNLHSPLVDEVIKLIREKNPQFAKGFQVIGSLILQKSKEILENTAVTSGDLNNISKAVSNINDTLQVVPKSPSIAQQFNFGNKTNQNANNGTLKVEIEFK